MRSTPRLLAVLTLAVSVQIGVPGLAATPQTSHPLDGLQRGDITTIAGGGSYKGFTNSLQAPFLGLCAVAVDRDRDVLYFSDAAAHVVFRVGLDDMGLEILAGTEIGGFNGDGMPGPETDLQVPCQVAVEPRTGDVYVADTNNYRIRAITRDGSSVKTVVGMGVRGQQEPLPTIPPVGDGLRFGNFSGDGGPPTEAELNLPAGIAFDDAGNLYVADTANNRIRVVNNGRERIRIAGVTVAPGTIETIAGTGRVGYTGDGGPATRAELAHPREVVVDREGTIYFVDSLNVALRRIDGRTGVIDTLLTSGSDPWTPETGLMFPLSMAGLAIGPDGDLYYSDLNRHAIFRIPVAGSGTHLFAGIGIRGVNIEDGDATRIPVSGPGNLAVGRRGEVYFIETIGNAVRVVENQRIRTVAGGGAPGEGVLATDAYFSIVAPIGVSPDGDVYLGDLNLQSIRRVSRRSGLIDTFAGNLAVGGARRPSDYRIVRHARATNVEFDGPDHIYVSDGGLNVVREFRRSARGRWEVEVVAGDTFPGNGGDGGPATRAQLSVPIGITLFEKDLLIAGIFHPRIRRVDSSGIIHAFAGTGVSGYSGDGGPATEARFDWPTGLDADDEGNVYIADFFNNRIRVVSRDGVVRTFAGTGDPGYSGDGGPALQARLWNPVDVLFDREGNLYVADGNNHAIRRIEATPPYQISTVAGTGTRGYGGDDGPATKALLNVPRGIALSPDESILYITDSLNRRVRAVRIR